MKDNVFFDTCVYHQPGIELLLKVVRSTTYCSVRKWSVRSGGSTRDGAQLRRHQALHRCFAAECARQDKVVRG